MILESMANIEHQFTINATPAEIFNLLCQVEEMPRYECNSGPVELVRVERLGGVIGSELDECGLALGSMIRHYRTVRGQLTTFDSELVEYEPGRIIAWRSLTPPVSTTRFVLVPQDVGTVVKVSATMQLSWPLELLFPLFRPAFKGNMRCMQERINSILTAPPGN
jgi:hypothetical protein